LPDNATEPIPWSILTVVALVTAHWRVAEAPGERLDGFASKLMMTGTWPEGVVVEGPEAEGGADTVTQPAAKTNANDRNNIPFPILSPPERR